MPSARTTIFGSCLKSRFGVNGIQYSSIEIRARVRRFLNLGFGVAHRYLLALNLLGEQGGLESYTRESVTGSDSALAQRITESGFW